MAASAGPCRGFQRGCGYAPGGLRQACGRPLAARLVAARGRWPAARQHEVLRILKNSLRVPKDLAMNLIQGRRRVYAPGSGGPSSTRRSLGP